MADWLLRHGFMPDLLQSGQKILQLEVKKDYNIRFIDSFSFTQLPLSGFPKTFVLTELTKGYFPHQFNTDDNQNYVGKYPDKEFYGYEQMKMEEKQAFDDWYKTVENEKFDFKKEMYLYCKSDVVILRQGCLKLRELFINHTQIDPFQYITMAAVCMAIFRDQFLPENTISVCDETVDDTYSIKSMQWLKYVSQKENINIRHACNGGEVALNVSITSESPETYKRVSLKVDGYCAETQTVYQFHGCYYHGCQQCYEPLTINKKNHYNMKYLFDRTSRIDQTIITHGYNLVTIWEHVFDKNVEMKNTKLTEYDLVEPPKIRENAFYGGRTEPFKLIYDFAKQNTRGKYIDVVSLYPTVMYYDKFPIGHPIKICKPQEYNENWFGFIHCRVAPPRGLYLPVLPYKQKTKQSQKLLFGLCRSCMQRIDEKCQHFKTTENKIKCDPGCSKIGCVECKMARMRTKENCQICYNHRNSECTHTDEERAITGFWTTVELKKALEKGYQIMHIYEVWHFEQTSDNLFKEYIRN